MGAGGMAMVTSRLGCPARISVVALLLLGTSLAGAAAQGRRGSQVRIDMSDGARVEGELVVVGGSSVTVRDRSGAETAYEFGGIVRVTVAWSKKKFPGGFVGFAAGAGVGYAIGSNPRGWPHDDDTRVLSGIGKGLLLGAFGALIGSVATMGKARRGETVFLFQGQSDDELRETLKRLEKHARIRH
jgi:hypothetical protein